MSIESTQAESLEAERLRMNMASIINSNPKTREELARDFGNVYDTTEVQAAYKIISFAAPFVYAEDRTSGKKGTLIFQHYPRFYYSFEEA